MSVSPERLLEWDPSLLFCGGQNLWLVRDDLDRRPELRSLAAIRETRSFTLLPVSHYHENVGSMLVDAAYVARVSAPEDVAAPRLETVADGVYRPLLGSSPFETIRAVYGVKATVDRRDGHLAVRAHDPVAGES
ncbi:MAG: hypothetical protein ACOCZC_02370 [Halodesulfurarchaeum sp.]